MLGVGRQARRDEDFIWMRNRRGGEIALDDNNVRCAIAQRDDQLARDKPAEGRLSSRTDRDVEQATRHGSPLS